MECWFRCQGSTSTAGLNGGRVSDSTSQLSRTHCRVNILSRLHHLQICHHQTLKGNSSDRHHFRGLSAEKTLQTPVQLFASPHRLTTTLHNTSANRPQFLPAPHQSFKLYVLTVPSQSFQHSKFLNPYTLSSFKFLLPPCS